MSLKAGRVGVNPADVDPIDGHISPDSVDSYTKAQADAKFETQAHAASTYETKSEAEAAHALLQPKTLAVPIHMLDGSKLTVEDALQGLNNDKQDHDVIEIAADSDISKLKEGLNSVVFRAGVTLGYNMDPANQVTLDNNMRGFLTRNGNVLAGCLFNYDATKAYVITSSEIAHIDVVRGITLFVLS